MIDYTDQIYDFRRSANQSPIGYTDVRVSDLAPEEEDGFPFTALVRNGKPTVMPGPNGGSSILIEVEFVVTGFIDYANRLTGESFKDDFCFEDLGWGKQLRSCQYHNPSKQKTSR